MMDSIVRFGQQLEKEIGMAKARVAQPVQEKMHIVIYMVGSDAPILIRYTDQRAALKDYDKLLKAADKGEGIALSSPVMTMAIRFPQNIAVAYVVDTDANNALMVDTQRRYNAAMMLP